MEIEYEPTDVYAVSSPQIRFTMLYKSMDKASEFIKKTTQSNPETNYTFTIEVTRMANGSKLIKGWDEDKQEVVK